MSDRISRRFFGYSFLFIVRDLFFSKSDVLELCQQYGPVANILMLKAKNQALVQFQELQGAVAIVSAASKFLISIRSDC
jgi:hypothetical protein